MTDKSKQYFDAEEQAAIFGDAFVKEAAAMRKSIATHREKMAALVAKALDVPDGKTVKVVQGYGETIGVEIGTAKTAKGASDKLAALGVAKAS